jgi:hypothetical protein
MVAAVNPLAPAAHSNSPDNLIVDCCTDGEEDFSRRHRRCHRHLPINCQAMNSPPGLKRITTIKQRIIMTS